MLGAIGIDREQAIERGRRPGEVTLIRERLRSGPRGGVLLDALVVVVREQLLGQLDEVDLHGLRPAMFVVAIVERRILEREILVEDLVIGLAQLVIRELAVGQPQRLLFLRQLAARQRQLLLRCGRWRRPGDVAVPRFARGGADARRVGVDLGPHRVHGLAVVHRFERFEHGNGRRLGRAPVSACFPRRASTRICRRGT